MTFHTCFFFNELSIKCRSHSKSTTIKGLERKSAFVTVLMITKPAFLGHVIPKDVGTIHADTPQLPVEGQIEFPNAVGVENDPLVGGDTKVPHRWAAVDSRGREPWDYGPVDQLGSQE